MRDAGHAARARLGRAGSPSVDEARRVAADVGYPVLLKAASGGGGRGMRLVDRARRARGARTRRRPRRPRRPSATAGCTSRRSSSTPTTSRCRCSATAHGGALVLGERECSVQRRHQKLLEESPSPFLSDEARGAAVRRRARRRARDALPQCRHDRVPARRRSVVLLHGDEHAPPGRAPGERGGDRHRPRALAAAARHGRAAPAQGIAPMHGHAIEFRINAEDPVARVHAVAGPAAPLPPAARARACASTRTPTRATRCRRPTTRWWPS